MTIVRGPTNLASQRWIEIIHLISERNADAIRSMLSDDFEGVDNRPTVAGPDADAEAFVAGALGAADVFDEIVAEEVLAVRGDRFALIRGRFASEGFVVPMLTLVEVDRVGLVRRASVLDDGDLAAAVEELDRRYLSVDGTACA